MEKIYLLKEQLRKFLVTYQGLQYPKPFKDYTGIREFVRRVGCVQYDPLNVVGRNIDLILQSRIENYETAMLEKLMYEDRALIDGWDKNGGGWLGHVVSEKGLRLEILQELCDEAINEVISCFERFCRFLKSSGLSDESYKKIVGH